MSKERVALLHSYLADRETENKPDRLTRIGIKCSTVRIAPESITVILRDPEPVLPELLL